MPERARVSSRGRPRFSTARTSHVEYLVCSAHRGRLQCRGVIYPFSLLAAADAAVARLSLSASEPEPFNSVHVDLFGVGLHPVEIHDFSFVPCTSDPSIAFEMADFIPLLPLIA